MPESEGRRNRGRGDGKYAYHFHYHGDWLRGVAGLTPEERGVYDTIINLMYERRAVLPDEDAWMARQCNCPLKTYRRIKRALAQKGRIVVDEENGALYDERCIKELARIGLLRRELADRGREGAEKRWSKARAGRKLSTESEGQNESFSTTCSESSQQEVGGGIEQKQGVRRKSAMQIAMANQSQRDSSVRPSSVPSHGAPPAAPMGGDAPSAPDPERASPPIPFDEARAKRLAAIRAAMRDAHPEDFTDEAEAVAEARIAARAGSAA